MAYLGTKPQASQSTASQPMFEAGAVNTAMGKLEISTVTAGTVEISGDSLSRTIKLPEWGSLPIEKISAGTYNVTIRYEDGKAEEKTIAVGRSEAAKLEFTYKPDLPVQAEPQDLPTQAEPDAGLRAEGVSTGNFFAAHYVILIIAVVIAALVGFGFYFRKGVKYMKVNFVMLIVALAIAVLIAFGFYSGNKGETYVWLITIASGIMGFIALSGTFAVSFEGRGSTGNVRVVSILFFIAYIISNFIFSFFKLIPAPYIIINGILFLLYILIMYGIIKALRD
jgi:hypothetical protein